METSRLYAPSPLVVSLPRTTVDQRKNVSVLFWSDFIAGCMAGSAGIVTGYPLDTIKVRQQTSRATKKRPTLFITASKTFSKEGPKALFRGMAFPLASEGFRQSFFFGIYGKLLSIEDWNQHPSLAATAVAAGIAGALQGVVATPIELIKVNLQSQNGSRLYSSPTDCFRKIYSNYGLAGVFKGLNITVFREAPALSVYMVSYFYLRDRLSSDESERRSLLGDLCAGGTAGVLSWLINMPVDVVKTRLQSDSFTRPKYSGIIDCFLKSYQEEGFRVFWRGLGVTCIRAFPTNAVTLVVYSKSLAILQQKFSQE